MLFLCCLTAKTLHAQPSHAGEDVTQSQFNSLRPAFFDGFNYDSTSHNQYSNIGDLVQNCDTANPSDNLLFGCNHWRTGFNSYSQPVRTWRRYNRGDYPTTGTYKVIEDNVSDFEWQQINDSLILVPINYQLRYLELSRDLDNISALDPTGSYRLCSDVSNLPCRDTMIETNFLLGDGTYAARVRMGKMPQSVGSDYIMSAFWSNSSKLRFFNGDSNQIDFWSETDFEFNRWYSSDTNARMSIGNHASSVLSSTNSNTNCLVYFNNQTHTMPNCARMIVDNKVISLEDRWMTLVYTVKKNEQTSWYLFSENYEYALWLDPKNCINQNYASSGYQWFCNEYGETVPIQDMKVLFGLISSGITPSYSPPLQNDILNMTMDIDWFYYTPTFFDDGHGKFNQDSFASEISTLQRIYNGRVNTLNPAPVLFGVYEYDHSPPAPQIRGHLIGSYFRLSLHPTEDGSDVHRVDYFRYRFANYNQDYTNWFYVYSNQANIFVQNYYSYIEVEARVRNHYYDSAISDIAYYRYDFDNDTSCPTCIQLLAGNIPSDYEISAPYPNPANNVSSFNIGSPVAADAQIRIFDLLGRLIYTNQHIFVEPSYSLFNLSVQDFLPGVYAVRVSFQDKDNGFTERNTSMIVAK